MRFQNSITQTVWKVAPGLLLVLGAGPLWSQHGPHGPDNGLKTPPNAQGQIAPRLQNLGSHTFRVKTRSRQAQQFFNQGINLSYGFNHAEAMRAFREVARLDPNCAMAYWGQALYSVGAQHQHGDGARGGAGSVQARSESRCAQEACQLERTRLHRRLGQAVFRGCEARSQGP